MLYGATSPKEFLSTLYLNSPFKSSDQIIVFSMCEEKNQFIIITMKFQTYFLTPVFKVVKDSIILHRTDDTFSKIKFLNFQNIFVTNANWVW